MRIWALADLHLSLGVPSKTMEVFGPRWHHYQEKMQAAWKAHIRPEDLILIPGDISWAIHFEEVIADLQWIDALPGTKLLLKGNHDYWWTSINALRKKMPPSIHLLHNNAFQWFDIAIGGSRLWDTPEYSYDAFIEYQENPYVRQHTAEEMAEQVTRDAHIFERELERLKLSLSQLSPAARLRIALTHYPPIGPDLKPSRASALLEQYQVDICVFGHMHNVKKGSLSLGKVRGVRYLFAAADYLDFEPLEVLS